MREVLVLATAGPGERDGIGDYAWMLAKAFGGRLIVKRTGATSQSVPDVPIENVASWEALKSSEWQERGRTAHAVMLQYFPQAFLASDSDALVGWLRLRRASKRNVTVTLHEYWPHAGPSPRRMLQRWRSRRALRALASVSTAMVVSQPYSMREVVASGLVHADLLHVIPVGSAIPLVPGEASPRAHPPILAMFGQPAMTSRGAVRAVTRWLVDQPNPPRLWWFSRSEDELQQWWHRAIGAVPASVTFHTGLAAGDLSRRLQQASIGLALYLDGASTRRSSLAALLEHKLPIVALEGRYTDDTLRQSGAFNFVQPQNGDSISGAVADLLADERRRSEMSGAAERLFASTLAWPRIAAKYRALEEGACA